MPGINRPIKPGTVEYIEFTRENPREYVHPRRAELLSIFDVTEEFSLKRRLLFERSKLEALKKKKNNLVKLRIDTAFKHRYIVDIFLIPLEHLIEKQEKSINFIKKKIKSIKDNKLSNNDNYPKDKRIEIDIDEIKRIPIRLILERAGIEILRNNFFKIRNEDTPSAQFNEDKNLWVDYGNANQGGSVIDLYMKLYGVNVADAIKELSLYL